MNKNTKRKKRLLTFSLATVILAFAAYGLYAYHARNLEASHRHAYIAIYIDGQRLPLEHPVFQLKSARIHVEDKDPWTLHLHAADVELWEFLKSIQVQVEPKGIRIFKDWYNTTETKVVRFYILDAENNPVTFKPDARDIQHYAPREGDKILISYGDQANVKTEMARIIAASQRPTEDKTRT